ncbi:Peptidase, prolyl oligopeptidase family protein [Thermococcus sp. 4557]|uniref:alpha/beta hydrolase family protein n=1 Tax=Thermococcus sp. (strain CGMCC 1.5172 / 4557) TaxID=1042877 RepID=UPI000219EC29|nr:S9 family peptidase [Thermococcus sp. 4557]AEK73435.1 Peptidase, prolyl oligopeptidase family protein [Thermococcus sp. 4557]
MSNIEWDEKTFSRFAYLGDPRIRGRLVAYVLTKANMEDNKYESTVVVEDLETGARRFIENASMPRISPDGKKLAFTRPNSEKKATEIWVADVQTLSAKRVLTIKNVRSIQWNDDSRRLLVIGFKRRDDEDFVFDDDVPAWFDSMGFFDGEKTTFWVLDTESEEIIEQFEKPRFSSGLWHGDSIAVNVPHREGSKPALFKFYDIYLWRDGEEERLFERVSFEAVDSDGKALLLRGKKEKRFISEHEWLYVWDGELKPVYEGPLDVYGAKLTDGKVYFLTPDAGRVNLWLWDGQAERVVVGNHWVYGFDVHDGRAVLLIATATRVPELYLYDGELKQITDYNGPIFARLKTFEPRHFRFKSKDLEIDGWYLRPELKEDEKAPVIVFVHGGPKGMYGHRFVYEMQLMAAKGYYIVFVNPRGSDGYDEDFALRVLERTGLEDFEDIMNGIEEFFKLEPQADRERVGITGISYGGFMTNWALTQSDLFKAGISENGISYWLTSYAFSDIGLWYDVEVIGPNPLENENYRKLSPLFYAENVKAPILLIHSLEDYRCPLDQSLMFYNVLKDMGKEAYIAVFKKGPHGHSIRGSPKHRSKRYRLFIEFFERKLRKYEEGFDVEKILKEG